MFDDGGNLTQTIVQTQLGNIGVIDNAIDFEQGPNYQAYASYVDEFVLNYYYSAALVDDESETLFDVLNDRFVEINGLRSLFVKEYYDSQGVLTDTTYVIRGSDNWSNNYGSPKIEFDNADTIIEVVQGRGRYPEYDVTIVIEPADLVDRGSYLDDITTTITTTNSFGLVQSRYAQYIDVSIPLEIEITATDPSGATASDDIDLMVQPESQSNVVDTTNTIADNESDTPLILEFLTSFDDALAASSTTVDGILTETVTDTNGVIWTQTFEYAIQTIAGTATETEIVTNSNGFSATIVGTVDYSGTLADLQSSNMFDSGDSVWIGTGSFGNFSVSVTNGFESEHWTGQLVTVDGGLLESVNLQVYYDSQNIAIGNGSAVRDGQTITFNDFAFYDLPVLELGDNEPQPPVDDTSPQLIQLRNTDTITKARASIDEYGTDYTNGDTGKLMKFELWIDATELNSFATTNPATEIRGYQFDINWNDLEVGALNFPTIAGTNVGFNATNPANSAITFNSELGSVAMASSTAIVDIDVSNDGPPSFIGTDVLIGTFYMNPNADLETMSLSIDNMLIVTDTDNISPADYTSVLEISSVDATIQTDATNYLDNLSLNYFKDGVDTGVSTLVEGGDISFPVTSLDFDAVKLSDPAAYTDGIMADDAVDVLRDIVNLDSLIVGSAAWHAADVNNDGVIAADDAVDILRHIVHLDEIDTFDLVDNITGNRISSLDTNAIDDGQWSIIANGDVDQSGGFVDAYVVQVDIV